MLRPMPTLLDSFSCRLASFSPAPHLELEKKNLIRFQMPDEEKCRNCHYERERETEREKNCADCTGKE